MLTFVALLKKGLIMCQFEYGSISVLRNNARFEMAELECGCND